MSDERDLEESIRVVRLGHGANCSSIGSLVDTLFATAVAGGAILAAITAALAREDVRVVGAKNENENENESENENDKRTKKESTP